MTAIQGVMPEEGADQKMPPGVLVEGPFVDAKFRDSYAAFGIMFAGTIAALVWAFTQGIGWVEISVFAGTFVLSTIGVGFMHRYFVHRSFRCGPIMRALFAANATMAIAYDITVTTNKSLDNPAICPLISTARRSSCPAACLSG